MNINFGAFIRYFIAAWVGSTLTLLAFHFISQLILVGPGAMALISLGGLMAAGVNTLFFSLFFGLIVAQMPINLYFALMWGLASGVIGLTIALLGGIGMIIAWGAFIGLWFFPQYVSLARIFSAVQIGAVIFIVLALTGSLGLSGVLIALGSGVAMGFGAYQGTKLS